LFSVLAFRQVGASVARLEAIMNVDQKKILQGKTPSEKLAIAQQMALSARELKAAALRSFHPDWTEEQVVRKVREVFLAALT